MNTKRRNDEKVVIAFERLFDDSLVPNSLEEADETIRRAGINPDKYRNEMRSLAAKLLSDSPLNWRNQSIDEIEATRKSLGDIKLVKNLAVHQILDRIAALQIKYPQVFIEPVLQAHRNLEEQSEEDLAYLLQEMIFRIKQAGIDLDEDQ